MSEVGMLLRLLARSKKAGRTKYRVIGHLLAAHYEMLLALRSLLDAAIGEQDRPVKENRRAQRSS